ncbi:MAG: hypothetical protein K8T20_20285 [Planctomycetes bacterium]|nr:hypothetical protein [Planctomycetota bacterium]
MYSVGPLQGYGYALLDGSLPGVLAVMFERRAAYPRRAGPALPSPEEPHEAPEGRGSDEATDNPPPAGPARRRRGNLLRPAHRRRLHQAEDRCRPGALPGQGARVLVHHELPENVAMIWIWIGSEAGSLFTEFQDFDALGGFCQDVGL